MSVDRVIRHPQYDSNLTVNDVGLLRLSQSVNFTDVIRPICLPSPDVDTDAFHSCVSTGFGFTSYEGKFIMNCISLGQFVFRESKINYGKPIFYTSSRNLIII